MNNIRQRIIVLALLSCTFLCIPVVSNAHLMKAQHGTLNFKDDGVYMVLSLPASAFADVDENSDNQFSMQEFALKRGEIIDVVTESIVLSTKKDVFHLQDVLVTPITPHDAPKTPAKRIVVLGKFIPANVGSPLHFSVGLFGIEPAEQIFEVSASKKSDGLKQVIRLTPDASQAELNFK